ncbi:MAG: TRAP transporter small permease [Xanthobacteraceae bacterium]|uniref:TRAP transporter small permease n=1 Tax=Pseudolabrys sp. TaxID=1960880 RepID=UPI003D12B83B
MTEKPHLLDRSGDAVAWTVEHVLAIALILAVLLNVVNVVGRYLTGVTLTGGDEIEIYILIWIAFLNAAAVSWRRSHLRMDLIVKAMPPRLQLAVNAIEAIVTVVLTAFVAWQSFLYVERIFNLGAVSDLARLPTWIPHSAVFIGFALMAVIAVINGLFRARRAGASDV